jgi:hypothetical protein
LAFPPEALRQRQQPRRQRSGGHGELLCRSSSSSCSRAISSSTLAHLGTRLRAPVPAGLKVLFHILTRLIDSLMKLSIQRRLNSVIAF